MRTEVNFEIPARELSFEMVREGFKTDFEVRVAVYDLNMDEVVSSMDVVDIDLPERPEPDSPWLLGSSSSPSTPDTTGSASRSGTAGRKSTVYSSPAGT